MKVLILLAAASSAVWGQGVQGLPGCPDGPLYTVIPMGLGDFMAFRPLGFVSLPSNAFPVKHSSFAIAMPGERTAERPVLFPGDVWVTEIWSYRSANFGGYQLYFQPCAQVRAYFFHLADIPARLKDAFEAAQPTCQDFADPSGVIVKCQVKLLLKVAAGEAAGVSGDGAGVDFGMADFRIQPEGLVNLEHYPSDYPYYVSPVEYYPADLRAQFASKLASWDGRVRRTAEPVVGSYRQDIAGTAQGNWFRPGKDMRSNSLDMTSNLALVSDYVDPEQAILMLGTSLAEVPLGIYSFVPTDSGRVNRRFRDVRADGEIYCYEKLNSGRSTGAMPLTKLDGVLLLTIPDENHIRVEKIGGAGATCEAALPWEMTGNAVEFER